MIGITNQISTPLYDREYEERCKRNQWDDLIVAITLLRNFNSELIKLHPYVTSQIKLLIMN